jgi:hypothetical protein
MLLVTCERELYSVISYSPETVIGKDARSGDELAQHDKVLEE